MILKRKVPHCQFCSHHHHQHQRVVVAPSLPSSWRKRVTEYNQSRDELMLCRRLWLRDENSFLQWEWRGDGSFTLCFNSWKMSLWQQYLLLEYHEENKERLRHDLTRKKNDKNLPINYLSRCGRRRGPGACGFQSLCWIFTEISRRFSDSITYTFYKNRGFG